MPMNRYQRVQTQSGDELERDCCNFPGESDLFSANQQMESSKNKEISVWKLTFNMFNTMEGSGFLALPYAIREGGLAALVAFALVPFVLAYTANLLRQCLDDVEEDGETIRRRHTYQEIARDSLPALEKILRVDVNTALFLWASSFLVLCGSVLSRQFPQVSISENQWACLVTLVILPTVFVKRFSHVAWLSLLSTIALVVAAGVIVVFEFRHAQRWDFSSLLFWDTRGFFVGLSIIFFSYWIHPVVVSMAAEVFQKSKFKMALFLNYFLGAMLKVGIALSGFLSFTINTREIISNNFRKGILVNAMSILIVLNVLLTYPVVILVFLTNIEKVAFYKNLLVKIHPTICFASLRIIVVLTTLLFSVIIIPHFALVNAINGCLHLPLMLIFPALFHLILKKKQLRKHEMLFDYALIIVGILGFGLASVTTIITIVNLFTDEH